MVLQYGVKNMSSSTTLLDLISSNSQQEPGANALFNSASPATLFARRESTTTGLTWGYYGGTILAAGVATTIANGTIALTASLSNYIETTSAGVVSKNTTGFTPGSTPLYTVVTGSSTVTSYIDHRVWGCLLNPLVTISVTSDANKTLTQPEARADILNITSSVSLTATRNVVVPLTAKQWTVANLTTGGQSLQFIGATGTGVTVASGMRAIIYADGTNIVRVTADI
jgi:hypothetical protein